MQSSETGLIEFFSECDKLLQHFSTTLQSIESGNSTNSSIGELYRDVHTLKGSAQLFGFQQIGQITHAIETALEPIRRLKIKIPDELFDAIFNSVNLIDNMIKKAREDKKETPGQFKNELNTIIPKILSAVSQSFDGEIIVQSDKAICFDESNKATVAINPPAQSLLKPSKEQKDPKKQAESSDTNSTVRIHVGLLDKLMKLVGEMVLIRNQMLQYSQKHDALEFLNLSQCLDAVISELQDEVMKTRMQEEGWKNNDPR